MSQQGTVYVVHENAATRDWLKGLLASRWIEVTCHASAEGFLETPVRHPACLILGLRLPGFTGLELQHRLNQQATDLPTIFLAAQADLASIVSAIKHGAIDFLQPPVSEEYLVQRVHQALEYDGVNQQKKRHFSTYRARFALLNTRERQVLDGLIRGGTSKVIGEELGLSRKTVDMYRTRLLHKTHTRSMTELAYMYGLIQPHDNGDQDPGVKSGFMPWPMNLSIVAGSNGQNHIF